MAKKLPKNSAKAGKNVAPAKMKNQLTTEATKIQKAAVAVDNKKKAVPKNNKKTKKTAAKPNIFKRMWKGIKGVFSELKKVSWPKFNDVMKSSVVVIFVVVAFFIVLFGIDYVLAGLLSLIVDGEWSTIFIS